MITIRDETGLQAKLNEFTPDNARLVIDFDETITAGTGHNSWSVFKGALGQIYTETAEKLYGIFSGFEFNTNCDRSQRERMLKRWWRHHLKLLQKTPLTQSHLNDDLITPLIMRKGIRELLTGFSRCGLPVLVFSGGITQVIEMILARDLGTDHIVHIIANRLRFGPDGVNTGISHEPIYGPNKTEQDQGPFPKEIAARTHTIIFGDSLVDRDMVSSDNPVISVGLLNQRKAHQMESFIKTFDIVVDSETCDGGVGEMLMKRIGVQ